MKPKATKVKEELQNERPLSVEDNLMKATCKKNRREVSEATRDSEVSPNDFC